MSDKFIWTMTLLALGLAACSHGGKDAGDQFAFLDNVGIHINDDLLLRDSLTLPDIYCGDPEQTVDDLQGERLDGAQYQSLIVPAGKDFADPMSNWMLLGVRDMGNGITMAAYYAGNGVGYCVDLMTYDKQGRILDAINARELHLLWRIDLSDITNDTVFTIDGLFTLDKNTITLQRTMGRCLMDFDGDLKGAPLWQQTWQQTYVVNDKGHFVLQGQRTVDEKGKVDQYAALDFKSWDMLLCSRHDPGVMDTWNQYSELVSSTYDPNYKYNPFPWDVEQLYHMNPQRFLRWMAAHRGPDNRLLPCFKLLPHKRPALLREINRLEDADARQWLTAIVASWDDAPLTMHL